MNVYYWVHYNLSAVKIYNLLLNFFFFFLIALRQFNYHPIILIILLLFTVYIYIYIWCIKSTYIYAIYIHNSVLFFVHISNGLIIHQLFFNLLRKIDILMQNYITKYILSYFRNILYISLSYVYPLSLSLTLFLHPHSPNGLKLHGYITSF